MAMLLANTPHTVSLADYATSFLVSDYRGNTSNKHITGSRDDAVK